MIKRAIIQRPLFAFMLAVTTLISACGGGGGGSSGPKITYVTVTKTSPVGTGNDVRTLVISAEFSASINPAMVANQKTAVSTLLSKYNLGVSETISGKPVSAANLKLSDFSSGKYLVTRNNRGINETLIIDSYEYVPEGNRFGMRLKVANSNQEFYYSAKEVQAAGISEQTIFVLRKEGSLSNIPGEALVVGNKITFKPVATLDWSSNYTVTISKDIKDTSGRSMAADYSWSFSTLTLPDAIIESVYPNGINGNPLKNITAKPNFAVDSLTLANNISLVKLKPNLEGGEPSRETLEFTASFDSSTQLINIDPLNDLDYLQEYEVTIKGSETGVGGTLGNAPVKLKADYTWKFSTGAPAVLSTYPSVVDENAPNIKIDDYIELDFNFRPNENTVLAGLSVRDSQGRNVPYTFSVTDSKIEVTPDNLLNYSDKYTVTVTPALVSKDRADIKLESDFSFRFSTVHRKIIQENPYGGSLAAEPAENITVKFNFDVDASKVITGSGLTRSLFNVQKSDDQNAAWLDVPGVATYDVGSRTLTFNPQTDFRYNAKVRVTVSVELPSTDGSHIQSGKTWDYTIKNQTMSVAGSTPSSGATYVPLATPIEVRMTYPIEPASFNSYNSLTVRDCNSSTVSGTTSYDGNRLFFVPSQKLKSFCKYTIIVNDDIRGTLNELQSTEYSFSFTTDGLEVDSVWMTYAYGDYIDIDSDIEIDFSHNISSSYPYDAIRVTDEYGYSVSGYTYRDGDSLIFDPYSGELEYGTEYKVTVSANVRGVDGEAMKESYVIYFVTENLPLDVVDYGPTGEVYVDDEFWVEMTHSPYTDGFPDWNATISPYESVTKSSVSYTLYATPSWDLDFDTDYWITFDFDFYHGILDDFDFDWQVYTELNYAVTSSALKGTGIAVNKTGRAPLNPDLRYTAKNRDLDVRKARSCRNDKSCVGSIKAKTLAQYKAQLNAKRRGDLVLNKKQIAKVRAQHKVQKLRRSAKSGGGAKAK